MKQLIDGDANSRFSYMVAIGQRAAYAILIDGLIKGKIGRRSECKNVYEFYRAQFKKYCEVFERESWFKKDCELTKYQFRAFIAEMVKTGYCEVIKDEKEEFENFDLLERVICFNTTLAVFLQEESCAVFYEMIQNEESEM